MRCGPTGGIENDMHWSLDVAFGEDQCRVRVVPCRTELRHPSTHRDEPATAGPHRQRWTQDPTYARLRK